MDKDFELAVCRYYEIVKEKCVSIINHIQLHDNVKILNKFELLSYLRSNKISKYQYNGFNYIFHGCGCTVFFDDNIIADWDFGFRSLWCGIDAYKMALTLKNNKYSNQLFYDPNFIRESCEKYAIQGDLILYKNQYYISLLKKGTIKTSFPDTYDELIINYYGKEIILDKTKEIDRFIRKSREIYKDIDKLDNSCLLIFKYKNKEIYRIFYNDIAYPDSSVEIMTHRILKPYIVGL